MFKNLNIFESKITLKGFHIETNINDLPDKTEIKDKLYKYFNKNPKERHCFQDNFYLIAKKPLINFLNPDIISYLKSYIFEIDDLTYSKIYEFIYNKYLIELNQIKEMTNVELSMFFPDQYEYQISYLLAENIENLIKMITIKKNNLFII